MAETSSGMANRRKGVSSGTICSPLELATVQSPNSSNCGALRSVSAEQHQQHAPLLELLQLLVESRSLDVLTLMRLGCCSVLAL
jgi:hypothetical protein